MDLTLLHPKVVHLPIALAVLMPLLSFGLLVAWWREKLPRATWLIAVVAQGILAVSSVAAMQTGEVDEEVVEQVVSEQAVEAHEEAAETFTYAAAALLLLFIAAVAVRKRGPALGLATAATLGTLVVFGLGYRTGQAGGDLVYKHNAASAHAGTQSQSALPSVGYEVEEDDD